MSPSSSASVFNALGGLYRHSSQSDLALEHLKQPHPSSSHHAAHIPKVQKQHHQQQQPQQLPLQLQQQQQQQLQPQQQPYKHHQQQPQQQQATHGPSVSPFQLGASAYEGAQSPRDASDGVSSRPIAASDQSKGASSGHIPEGALVTGSAAVALQSIQSWQEKVNLPALSNVISLDGSRSGGPGGGLATPGRVQSSFVQAGTGHVDGGATWLSLPHVHQLFNWDCGLACVLMVLQGGAVPAAGNADMAMMRRYCHVTSIWTIDLAHLLRRFGADVAMTTTVVGANPAFSSEAFYAANLPEDERRVHQLFLDAPGADIPVYEQSLGSTEIQEALMSGRYVVIALVDKTALEPPSFAPWNFQADFAADVAYIGHYIVVFGYCAQTDRYEIMDPATEACHVSISAATFERSRHAFGTDEDLLLVAMAQGRTHTAAPDVDFGRVAAAIAAF